MSSAILRRNSSKQGLQNLLRVTAQRSIEDAEEIERERRRRAREELRKEHSLSGSAGSPQDSAGPAEEGLFERDLKPSSPGVLDEDEGFSDWTHRAPEKGPRTRQDEKSPREEDQQGERAMNGAVRRGEKITSTATAWQDKESDTVDEVEERRPVRKSSEKRMEFGKRANHLRDREMEDLKAEVMRVNKTQEEEPRPNLNDKVIEKRKEVRVSYTSKVVLQQDRMPSANNKGTAGEEVTSQLFKTTGTTSKSVGQAPEPKEQVEVSLETEQRLEKIRRSHQEKESQELEQLRQRQAEAEVELEDLKRRREERRRLREEEERRREEEEQYRLAKEEEERKQMKEDIERRRMEAAEKRLKTLTMSCPDGDDSLNPLSPKSTFKIEQEERLTAESTCSITERTESLNRSLKKSNSFKKTQPPVLLAKIDDKLEQYAHAVESSSKEPRAVKSVSVDIPSVPEPVAAKKSLFEAGEAWSQSTAKCTPTKETDGLKVGVADLITQWVKGSPEGANRNMSGKQSDVKAGDVLQKKNMWEIIGEASAASCSSPAGKGTSSGKRYKFIVTGHGKYEKISIDNDDYSNYSNGKSGDLCHDDL